MDLTAKPVTWLSQRAFAVYFVHVPLVCLMHWYIDLSPWSRPVQVLLLESASFGGSLLLIWLLSDLPGCKKYLFMIKDGTKKGV